MTNNGMARCPFHRGRHPSMKLENDRFNRADQEGKLLFMDDDMRTEALPSTNNIKSIVTMEDKIDLERKGKQSVQGLLYVRIICFGNGSLKSLHDKSYGFYRRQILLTTKERPADRNARTYQVKTFNGLAQVLLQSTGDKGTATLTVEGEGLEPMTYTVACAR